MTQAIARVFGRLGEKKNRNRARIKFLVQDLGIEKFRELVLEERKTLSLDPRWTEYVKDAQHFEEAPLRPGGEWPASGSPAFKRWLKHNTRPQKQEGYVVVTVALPLGDITANSTSLPGGHRSPLHQRNRSHHSRAEFRHSLGQQKRLARNSQGAGSRRPWRSGRGRHR